MANLNPSSSSFSSSQGASIVGGESDYSGPGPEIMAADTLEGDNVYNQAGEKLGEIDHIMLDVRQGRIAYAVLSTGGVLGVGETLHAVPWSALTLDADKKCFVMNIDKERLSNAPGFDKDHWPSMADSTWAGEIYSYYGSQPYWQTRVHS